MAINNQKKPERKRCSKCGKHYYNLYGFCYYCQTEKYKQKLEYEKQKRRELH